MAGVKEPVTGYPRLIVFHLLRMRPWGWLLRHGPWKDWTERRLWQELSPYPFFDDYLAEAMAWDEAGRPPGCPHCNARPGEEHEHRDAEYTA